MKRIPTTTEKLTGKNGKLWVSPTSLVPRSMSLLISYTGKHIKKKFPLAEKHLEKVRDLFELYDSDKDDALGINELALMLQDLSSKITTLPAVSS